MASLILAILGLVALFTGLIMLSPAVALIVLGLVLTSASVSLPDGKG